MHTNDIMTARNRYYKTLFPLSYYMMSIPELDRRAKRRSHNRSRFGLFGFRLSGLRHSVAGSGGAGKDDSNLTFPALGSGV